MVFCDLCKEDKFSYKEITINNHNRIICFSCLVIIKNKFGLKNEN